MKTKENNKQLIEAIPSNRWITSKELKEELSLKQSTKKIGMELAVIARHSPDIQSMKIKGLWYYRTNKALSETIEEVPEQNKPESPDEPINTENDLKNLIVELKEDYGIDSQEVQKTVLNALRTQKEQLDKELEIVEKEAPNFLAQYKKLKMQVRNLKEDSQDLLFSRTKQQMLKSFANERAVQREILH